jgi:tRNA dimethylallyltransferase
MKVILLGGPTGSGKSALAFAVAKEAKKQGLLPEILCCDSITIYRGFNIGSAKPTKEEQREFPHHLIDIADPTESFTAGDFLERAAPILKKCFHDQKLPIIVGGTGFYLRALLRGMATDIEDQKLSQERKIFWEQEGEKKGWKHLFEEVKKRDPQSEIHENDHYRLVRALQAMDLLGKPWSQQIKEARAKAPIYPHKYYYLNPSREELRKRVIKRTKIMLESGFLEEVKQLLSRGVPEDCKPMQSVGYKEALHFLKGELSDLESAIVQNTMKLAKQQSTWFRGEELAEELPQPYEETFLREALRIK